MRYSASVLGLLLISCAHKPEQKIASVSSAPAALRESAPVAPLTPEGSCSADTDCHEKQLCIRNRCVDISGGLAECSSVRVHFPFNSAIIESSEQVNLDRSARCLKADHALHVAIEGNADERGTEEYNIALGDKRASSVKAYLERLGASEHQLKTVSYGKENPLCTQHDEECWAKNRRAELKMAGQTRKLKQ